MHASKLGEIQKAVARFRSCKNRWTAFGFGSLN